MRYSVFLLLLLVVLIGFIMIVVDMTTLDSYYWNSLPLAERRERMELAQKLDVAWEGDLVHFTVVSENDTLITTGRITQVDERILWIRYPGPASAESQTITIHRRHPQWDPESNVQITGVTRQWFEPDEYHSLAGWYFTH